MAVRMSLPAQYAAHMRSFLARDAEFAVTSQAGNAVEIAPREGAGAVRRYFTAHKVADARTNIASDEPWAFSLFIRPSAATKSPCRPRSPASLSV